MALQHPVPGATLTQKYGPSSLGVEPAMYANSTRAYWQFFNGSTFYFDYHPALDLAAAGGTPILASEAGRVVESYFDSTNGGGNKVTVEIRPNVRYTSNHMATRLVSVGTYVARGQKIGTVGTTGWSSGQPQPLHGHHQGDRGGRRGADVHVQPGSLFLPGGSMAGDPRVAPITPPSSTKYARVNGAGINIRRTPDLDVGSGNVFATSTAQGIVRNGEVLAPLDHKFKFGGWVSNDDGAWAKIYLRGAYRFCKKELIHFV